MPLLRREAAKEPIMATDKKARGKPCQEGGKWVEKVGELFPLAFLLASKLEYGLFGEEFLLHESAFSFF